MQAAASGSGTEVLRWLLAPAEPAAFLRDTFDRSVLLVRRPRAPEYNTGCFGSADLWRLLGRGDVAYGTQVDVTTFSADKLRQTFNYNASSPPVQPPVRLSSDCNPSLQNATPPLQLQRLPSNCNAAPPLLHPPFPLHLSFS